MPKEADEFWLARLACIDRGVVPAGRVRAAALVVPPVRPHRARLEKVERFQALATEAERRDLYAREWQTYLWRQFGGMIWKRWFDVGADRLERLLLEGRLLAPPPQLSAAEFENAKELANRVLVVNEPPQNYLRSIPGDSVDAFLLGRMDLRGLEGDLCRVARPGARAVVRDPAARAPSAGRLHPPGDAARGGLLPGSPRGGGAAGVIRR
jgi:hypothetical protein